MTESYVTLYDPLDVVGVYLHVFFQSLPACSGCWPDLFGTPEATLYHTRFSQLAQRFSYHPRLTSSTTSSTLCLSSPSAPDCGSSIYQVRDMVLNRHGSPKSNSFIGGTPKPSTHLPPFTLTRQRSRDFCYLDSVRCLMSRFSFSSTSTRTRLAVMMKPPYHRSIVTSVCSLLQ